MYQEPRKKSWFLHLYTGHMCIYARCPLNTPSTNQRILQVINFYMVISYMTWCSTFSFGVIMPTYRSIQDLYDEWHREFFELTLYPSDIKNPLTTPPPWYCGIWTRRWGNHHLSPEYSGPLRLAYFLNYKGYIIKEQFKWAVYWQMKCNPIIPQLLMKIG